MTGWPYRDGMTTDTVTTHRTTDFSHTTALRELDRLARRIDREGFEAATTGEIEHLVALATAAKASPVLCGVLADTTAPPAVRERAFGLLAMQILARADRSTFAVAA
jgi:hypothetical protein